MTTKFAVAYSDLREGDAAGVALGTTLLDKLGGAPDVIIIFISPDSDQQAILASLQRTCHPEHMLGCSSAGEFTGEVLSEGLACALAIRSDELFFSVGLGRELSKDYTQAGRTIISTFRYPEMPRTFYRTALLLSDILSGGAEDLITSISQQTDGTFRIFGGGAGDNARFARTPVFFGTEIYEDAAVALEILSKKPVGIGSHHGWHPVTGPMLVTRADGLCLISLDGRPALDAFQEYAQATGQALNPANPVPFFLHNVLGIDAGLGLYKLRAPLAVHADGSLTCATEVPEGAIVSIMSGALEAAVDAASQAAQMALRQMHACEPGMTLFFDCVVTRLRMGDEFNEELHAVQHIVGAPGFVGCNTHGQVVSGPGQFSGFHNCNAVVCILPA